ncbi:efflux RND transporter periplasmic adaptor subunit [Paenibacillus radicis (ex Xue et al. 2023)]|uniref:Efflux transporter periplasmic adaptor subunit n=1 Tax=Paenibacillus radicis (ex Xue et al. 2023) TaxID=2972489 RepID=A0ABT1YDL7_9BACL|nr:efflux transporter periplasmic adaptor subunit [Paenibacillus radicis (ex Xue et al. 2023)]MCR8631271.1 efflux transporter periplasmic adaptor subunit [Paenibacillus radicis (ex Xue et al. 2023)]
MVKLSNKLSRKLLLLAAVGIVTGTLSGCSLLPVEEEDLQPPLVQPVKETLNVVEAKRSTIAKQITGVATFVSDKTNYLYYKTPAGKLISIDVKLGDKVKAGDVVASTETSELETKIRLQEIAIEKVKISFMQEIADKGAEDPAVRLKVLDMESAQLQLKALQTQVANSRLVAQSDGIVTFVEPLKSGEEVSAYKQIVTLSDPSQIKLVYTASSQNDLAGVEVNMDVAVKIKDKMYSGKVVQTPISAAPSDNKTIQDKNNKSLVIDVKDAPSDATIGSQADITVVTEKRDNVVVIPRAGLRSYMGRDYVQVLDGESRKEIDVEKGIVAATEVEIRKGISDGQKIIMNN